MVEADVEVRRARVLELRASGLTFPRIAEALGISQRYAQTLLSEAAVALREQRAAEYRVIANASYDASKARLWEIITVRQDPTDPQSAYVHDAERRIRALAEFSRTVERQARMNGACEPDTMIVVSQEQKLAEDERRAQELLAEVESYRQGVIDAQSVVKGSEPSVS